MPMLQNDQFCEPELVETRCLEADHIGAYLCLVKRAVGWVPSHLVAGPRATASTSKRTWLLTGVM